VLGKNAIDKRARILSAAVKVFAEHGFHNSKVSEIAKKAKVADGTIYLYCKNKDDILISLFEESLKLLINNMREAVREIEDPLEKIRVFIRLHFESVEKFQGVAEVMQVELRQSHKFMKEYVPQRLAEYLNIVSEIIEEGKAKGVIKEEIHPAVFKRALFGAMDEIALHWVLIKRQRKRAYELSESAEHVSKIFLDGIKATGGSRVDTSSKS
jgi:TetR/AcrR family fatty acid metabolism transcriptional regulator